MSQIKTTDLLNTKSLARDKLDTRRLPLEINIHEFPKKSPEGDFLKN